MNFKQNVNLQKNQFLKQVIKKQHANPIAANGIGIKEMIFEGFRKQTAQAKNFNN
jgi:hypothetical protein